MSVSSLSVRPPSCLSIDDVVGFALGAGSADARAPIELHLDRCVACQELVAEAVRVHHGSVDSDRARRGELSSLAGTALGRFTLERYLGGGAMGVVYAAHDSQLRREVALKLSRPGVTGSDRTAEATVGANLRALAEARALARLEHPNVVSIHDLGVIDDVVFIVMERIDGEALDAWMRGAPTIGARRAVLAQVARGVACAHAAGLIHGDVKPANVVVAGTRAVVVDFGVAIDHGAHPHERAGLRGTPAYMAPELRRGGAATPASDVFAFATMAIECLTGARPHGGEAPRWSAAIPARLRRALEAGRADDPERRPRLATVVAALEVGGGRPRRWIAAGAVALAAIAGVAWARQPDAVAAARARCEADAADRAARLWSPLAAARLRTAFVASGPAYASTTAATVATRLERWRDEWQAHAAVRCHAPSPPSTTACLEQLYRQAQGRVRAVTRADPGALEHAVADVYELPMSITCTTAPAAVLETLAVDDGDPILAAVERARADVRAGRLAEVDRDLRVLGDEQAWRAHPARAQLYVALGQVEARRGHDVGRAERYLATGAQLADAQGHDHLRAEAQLELAHLRSERSEDPDGAGAALAQAETAATRAGRPPGLVAKLEVARATQELRAGDDVAAARRLRALIDAEASEPPSPGRARHLDLLAIALVDRDPAAAERAGTEARDLFAELLGARHPDTAAAMMGIATAKSRRGDLAGAIAVLSDALERLRGVIPDEREPALALRTNLALTLAEAGRADEAIATLTDLVELEQRRTDLAPCARRLRVGAAQLQLAAAMANAGAPADALRPLEQGLAAYDGCEPPAPQLAHALYFHGSVVAMVEGPEAGVPSLERALALLASSSDLARAAPSFMLAQLLRATAPRRAHQLAEQARRAYLAAGATADAAEIDRWMSAR